MIRQFRNYSISYFWMHPNIYISLYHLKSKTPLQIFHPIQQYLNQTNADEVLHIIFHMQIHQPGMTTLMQNPWSLLLLKIVELLEPLIHICNLYLSRGEFPDNMTIARVVPIQQFNRRLCVLLNTKLYHRHMLLWISTKFAFWKNLPPPVQSNIKPN